MSATNPANPESPMPPIIIDIFAITPNGSLNNIAGIFNEKKNILGMMPHPERMIDNIVSSDDGINLFSSLMN